MTTALEHLTAALSDRYRLERELGQGGMATVYLARDLRHDRKVALKVLRPDLAAAIGAERFLQEIKTTANLQHPHILPLHDSGQVDGTVFYVMPYVEGESLRDRLTREKQLPIHDAVRIAREVADALGYAHEHGVIHRDIKPENILLQRGHALVADFGIALAASRSGGASRLTEAGMSLGTPTYMSPEQAMGERDLTARSDLYALGCTLYEALTGEPPFTGPTAQAIIARLMTDDPRPPSQLRRAVPPNVEAAILTALEKVPADRFATAAEFAQALGSPSFTHATPSRPRAAAALRLPLLRDPRTWVTIAAVGLAAALVATRAGTRSTQDREGPTMSTLLPPSGETWLPNGSAMALSPDGRTLAIVATGQGPDRHLVLRSMDSLGTARLRGTEHAVYPFWSPDGSALGFFADGQLKRFDLASGGTRSLCPTTGPGGGSWSRDGTILYWPARLATIYAVNADGGVCRELGLKAAEGKVAGRPYFFPDGKTFIVTSDQITWLGHLGDDSVTKLVDTYAAQAVLAPPDYLLTRSEGEDGRLYAQRIDLAARRMIGALQPVVDRVSNPGGHVAVAASPAGALVAAGPGGETRRLLGIVTRATGALDTMPLEPEAWTLRVSRDGRRVALGGWGLWMLDLTRRVFARAPVELDTGRVVVQDPVWAPGDSLLAFKRGYRDPGFTLFDTGSERPSRWLEESLADRSAQIDDWSPDGKYLAMALFPGTNAPRSEIWLYDIAAKTAKPLVAERADVGDARFSPDGRWMAYRSNADGETEIYLRAFPGMGRATRVSLSGGRNPRWRGDSRELFYTTPEGRVMAISLSAEGRLGTPALAFSQPIPLATRSVEPTPDGQRFVYLFQTGGSPGLTLIQNWRKLMEPK